FATRRRDCLRRQRRHRSARQGLRQSRSGAIVDTRWSAGSLSPRRAGQVMGEFGIGQPVRRFEDKRLLSGNGHFQNDNNLLGQAYAYVLRSPHAHALSRALDLTTAKAASGVVLIMTGNDLVEAKLVVMGVT